jgi:hypothetical protein
MPGTKKCARLSSNLFAYELECGPPDSDSDSSATRGRYRVPQTGLNVIIKRTAGGFDHEMPQVRVSSMFYDVVVTGGTLRVSSEHCEAKWFEASTLTSLDLAPTVKGFFVNWG